ncbi:hypothetical protein D3C76_1195900 [compost metagenome]
MQRRRGRALGDHVDQATWLVLAIEHRGRALHHLDTFQRVRIDLQRTAGTAAAIRQVQAVQVQRRRAEAAGGRLVENPDPVGETTTGDTRGVAQGLGDRLRAKRLDFILGDDVDGLRHFQH